MVHSLVQRLLLVIALGLGLGALPALSEGKKLALVVGNAAYEHAPSLATPVADAQAMAASLRGLGFEVTVLTDVGTAVFQAVLTTFADQAKGADTVLFYYAGHAFQMEGVNHLVPISARLDDPAALEAETWTLDAVAAALKRDAGQLLIFMDACRDNPLPQSLRAAGSTSAGLAQFDGGAGTFVSFATAPGQVAWDSAGGGANSPYTAALLSRLDAPGQSLSDLMIAVRNDVFDATGGKQTPWEQSSLRAQFFFNPGGIAPAADPAAEALPDFDLVDAGSEVVAGDILLAAALPAADASGKLRLQPLTSETRSLAVLNGVPVEGGNRLTAQDAASPGVTVPPAAELPRAVQAELKRIGCYGMAVDGDWGNGSRNAMRQYYKAKGSAEGEVEPTEAVFLALSAEPEKTCAEAAPVAVKKAPAAQKPATKKKQTTTKQTTSQPKQAAPAKKKGVECKFIGIAVICS